MTSTRKGMNTEHDEPRIVEWIVGAGSTLLVTLLIGWITWEALTNEREPPAFVVRPLATEAVADGYRVEFSVENTAGSTAAAVVVHGDLETDGETERNDVTFDYVPARSQAKGAFFFTSDPRAGNLTIRAVSYTEP